MIELNEEKTLDLLWGRVYGEGEWREITEALYARLVGLDQ